MKEPPLIKIITVCKNDRYRLAQTIKSVLLQERETVNVVHIIVDGSSSDGTLELLRRYQHAYPVLTKIISEPDSGIYQAMNRGVKADSIDGYTLFLNAGDVLYDKYVLLDISSAICREGYPDILSCSFGYQKEGLYWDLCGFMDMPKKVRFGALVCQQSLVYSSKCFSADLMFDENYRIAGDYEHLLRLLQSNISVSHFPRAITRYSGGGVSESSAETGNNEVQQIRYLYT